MIMPPGWDHTGNHKLAKDIRQQYLKEHAEKSSIESLPAGERHKNAEVHTTP
jgi:hypothetical protein